MNWNCTLTEERLSDFLEGALAPEEREACSAHSAGCAKCAETLERVGDLVGHLHALEPLREPAFLARRIINGTARSQTQRHELASVAGWFNLIWQPRFAMGVATVAMTFVILAHAMGARIGRLRPSDLNPVNLARAGNRQVHLTYARGEKFVNDLRVVYEIRAMLASPQATPSGPSNQATPQPGGKRPDTGEHRALEFQQEAEARNARSSANWAMLPRTFGGNASHATNRSTL